MLLPCLLTRKTVDCPSMQHRSERLYVHWNLRKVYKAYEYPIHLYYSLLQEHNWIYDIFFEVSILYDLLMQLCV